MKIHVYLLCFNEEKIIKSVIDYYESFCSQIFIMDNMSTDSSVEIARQYECVTIIPWESSGIINESLYIKMKASMYKNYSRAGGRYTREVADWVIACDMDELLYHPNIVEVLSAYKEQGVSVPQITGFNMVGENDISMQIPILEQYDRAVRAEGFDKRIVFDCNFDMSYEHGCHPRGVGFEHMKRTYGYKTSDEFKLTLLHYKHIGRRLYDSALKNHGRLSESDDLLVGRGKASAVAKYYKNVVKNKQTLTPLLGKAKAIFDDEKAIKFSQFKPNTGEIGLIDPPSQQKMQLPDGEINIIRDAAMAVEKYDISLAMKLMGLALALRPNGAAMQKKMAHYQKLLDDSNE